MPLAGSLIGLALATILTGVQAPPGQPPSQPTTSQPAMHWLQRLGLRSAQVQRVVPLIDRVVLVPDAATYVDELSKWSPKGRWPVLIEDEHFTPMFVRRFAPRELIRREAIDTPLPDDAAARQRALEKIVVGAIGGDAAAQTIRQAFDQQKYTPPGVVVASTNDPAWTAAVALAAGHLQPLIWIDDDFGPVNGELNDARTRQLAEAIDRAVESTRYTFRAAGDDIDAITLCRHVPVAARVNLPAGQRAPVPAQHADGPVALTDFLGRNADGSRYAVTGWIFGDERRCAYMAMCALFLPRDNALLLNTYASDGEWGLYSTTPAAEMFTKGGIKVDERAGEEQMSEAAWRRMLVGGVASDVILMNSGGNADYFNVAGGVAARPGDVPVLNQPAALHLIHSWSLRSPAASNTVGGRWLDHGVYAMTGSCHEPFLAAFVQPQFVAARLMMLMPFLPASRRQAEEGLAQPWRVVTIGDPLMLVPPPAAPQPVQPPRVGGQQEGPQDADYGVNLLEVVKALMRRADAEASVDAFVQSMRILDMLGKDDAIIQMWRLSQQKGLASGRVASAALPALFRKRDHEGFLQAWMEGGPRTPLHLDMLWHLMQARLGGPADRDMLAQLQAAVRPDAPAFDVERLAPHVISAFGQGHLRQFISREIEKTSNAEQQRLLREIASPE
jgi:hypothetical protein